MGNIVLMKIPTVGGLVHFLTSKSNYADEEEGVAWLGTKTLVHRALSVEAFKVLPEGTVNFISGSGRSTMPPIMASGDIDGLAFIGGSNAADDLIKQHPNPHRLKVFLQLEANNMAVSNLNAEAAHYILRKANFCPFLLEPNSFTCLIFLVERTRWLWKMLSKRHLLGP